MWEMNNRPTAGSKLWLSKREAPPGSGISATSQKGAAAAEGISFDHRVVTAGPASMHPDAGP
jgi:hypothetical protein